MRVGREERVAQEQEGVALGRGGQSAVGLAARDDGEELRGRGDVFFEAFLDAEAYLKVELGATSRGGGEEGRDEEEGSARGGHGNGAECHGEEPGRRGAFSKEMDISFRE